MTNLKEITLLNRLSRGDEEAFSELYEQYKSVSYAFVFSLVKDSSVSKDIVHDVFVKLWVKRDTLQRVVSFNAYLFQMLKNAVFDYFEVLRINRRYVTEMVKTSDEFSDITNSSVDFNELQLLVFETVSKMPERRRQVFQMSRYQNIENKEISLRLGIDIRTVENHISAALAEIRLAVQEVYA